jgi:hypothetical protein
MIATATSVIGKLPVIPNNLLMYYAIRAPDVSRALFMSTDSDSSGDYPLMKRQKQSRYAYCFEVGFRNLDIPQYS